MTKPSNSPAPKGSTGGAKAALDGYEYQLDVSVYAALRLLLITKSATRITLEPANEEDLEVDLEPDTPGRVVPSANVSDGYKLVIQVKLRASGPWSVAAVDALLKHGKRRRPAKHHLDDPNTRFLLITTADVANTARSLLVEGLEEWPETEKFPRSLKATLPNEPEGRIAIWGQFTERLVDLEINEILGTLMRVPYTRLSDCRALLQDEARRRMRGTCPGVWTCDDLLATIRSFGGYLASAPELEAFVPPANYDAMKSKLEVENAVVITGPSGTGKTLAALALCDSTRRRTKLEIINVNVNNDPSSTRSLVDSGPMLYYIEDPWGQYSLRGGSEAWTEQLPRLLREARPEHQYVITSRTDMLGSANAERKLERWSITLDAEHYREGELARIYEKRINLLATDRQSLALEFRKVALNKLETPLELDLFFTYLADGPNAGEVNNAFFERIVALAHRDAVEDVVFDYLSVSDKSGCAAIVWSLLAARSQFDRRQLTALQRQIRTIDATFGDSLEKLVNRLVATRHLRQPTQTVSFSHPSVRAGFEQFMTKNWVASEQALDVIISALTQISGPLQNWSLETAARIIDVAEKFIQSSAVLDAPLVVEASCHAAIDQWLDSGLVDTNADFQALLQLASDVGTNASIPSELARWFITGVQRGGQWFMDDWQPPSFEDDWYDRVSADPRSFFIADRFVREQLPQEQTGFGKEFPSKLDRIAGGLVPAFLATTEKLVTAGHDRNIGPAATGAIRDITAYERVLGKALDEFLRLNRSYEKDANEQWQKIQDGECDAGYDEYYQSSHEDDGYSAGIIVSTYISEVRTNGRWQSLFHHPRVSELARSWSEDICRSPGPVSVAELRALITATLVSGDEEHAWDAVRLHWCKSMATELENRILHNCPDQKLRNALAYCALSAEPIILVSCFDQIKTMPGKLMHLLVDVHSVHQMIDRDEWPLLLRRIFDGLPNEFAEIFNALATKKQPVQSLGAPSLALLEQAVTTEGLEVLEQIVPVMIASGATPSVAIGRWLMKAPDNKSAQAATDAAISIGDETLVRQALFHARADARQSALKYLAGSQKRLLAPDLLALSSDPGSRVRRTLVSILHDRPHPDHLATLVQLINDNWSNAEPHHDEDPSYPIAREAVAALGNYERLSAKIGEKLITLADRSDDRALSIDALNIAVQKCDDETQKKIWTLSLVRKPRWVRVDAIDALITAEVVHQDIIDKVTAKFILSAPPPLAASASILLAAHGRVDVVVQAMERIANSAQHQALLLLGAWVLSDRDRNAASRLLRLLGPEHPAKKLLDLESDERLPKNVLDDLGNIRIRQAVGIWLKSNIAED